MYPPVDPDSRMTTRIECGPEVTHGRFEIAEEALARSEGESKYAALQRTFGPRDDGSDPLAGWDIDNISEFLRCALGAVEDFSVQYERMSEAERTELFPDPTVAEILALWVKSATLDK